jgi:hypothetical protein
VTGHFRAGEGLAEALRESKEEIGLALGPADVVRIGTRRRRDESTPGIRDKRAARDPRGARRRSAARELSPGPDEVDALLSVALSDALRLFATPGARVPAQKLEHAPSRDEGHGPPEEVITAPDKYYSVALSSVGALVSGRKPVPWQLGDRTVTPHPSVSGCSSRTPRRRRRTRAPRSGRRFVLWAIALSSTLMHAW